jgi:hypothetical protein
MANLCGGVRLALLVASFTCLGARAARAATGGTFDPSRSSSQVEFTAPFTANRVSASLGLGFGSNDLNFGFGARAGYTIRPGIYVGALGDYWLGKSLDELNPGFQTTGSARAWDVFGNVGYDLAPSETLVLRPFAGYGALVTFGDVCTSGLGGESCQSNHDSKRAGLVGTQLLFDVHPFTLGGELRALFAGDVIVVASFGVGTTF